jgi:acyl-CoA thioesterase-1
VKIFDKLRAGHSPVVVGYLGGSITAGVGATDPESTSWRALTTRWFRERFPGVEVRECDASLRGTGSDLAAYRVEMDLLRHRPDLIFIEFAVNDHRRAPAKIIASMEGLIRKIRRMSPQTEIILVLATMRSMAERHPGKTPSEYAHEKVANHYELAAVNVGRRMIGLIERGESAWESLTTDGCHPTDKGHALFAREVREALVKMMDEDASVRLLLPEPLSPDRLEWGKVVPISPIAPSGWWYEDEPVGTCLRGRLASNLPGATLTFSFVGDAIGLFWIVAHDSGAIEYVIDDRPPVIISAWDEYAMRSPRAHYRILAEKLEADRCHVLTLQITRAAFSQSNGSFLRIGGFLVHHCPV